MAPNNAEPAFREAIAQREPPEPHRRQRARGSTRRSPDRGRQEERYYILGSNDLDYFRSSLTNCQCRNRIQSTPNINEIFSGRRVVHKNYYRNHNSGPRIVEAVFNNFIYWHDL